MRISLFVFTLLLAIASAATAQTNPGSPATPPAATPAPIDPKLDGYLLRWEQEMQKVTSLAAALARFDKDPSFKTTRKFAGKAEYMKVGTGPTALNLAALEMKEDGKADLSEKFICTGTYLYQYLPAQKEIKAYELPKSKPGQMSDDNFLGFMFGMKAEEAKKRYHLSLFKEDNWYIYVDIAPRYQADKADFVRARLVLNKDTCLPRQLWFEHGNGNEITWDIPAMKTGVTLDRRNFDSPKLPPGWKFQTATRPAAGTGEAIPAGTGTAQPRVIRSAQDR